MGTVGARGVLFQRLASADAFSAAARAPVPSEWRYATLRCPEPEDASTVEGRTAARNRARAPRNKEIARQLGVAHGTVKVHVAIILHKFNVPRRYDLGRVAMFEAYG